VYEFTNEKAVRLRRDSFFAFSGEALFPKHPAPVFIKKAIRRMADSFQFIH